MSHREFYESPEAVRYYASLNYLEAPENMFLKKITAMKQPVMLDIGIGAGRTTRYFAPLTASYTGIDFSKSMIDACKKRFADIPGIILQQGDARNMKEFPGDSFDIVLFSFNGLDTLSHEDRLLALSEMKRVARPGGIILFSSHNLNIIGQYFRFRLSLSPIGLLREIKRLVKIYSINKQSRKEAESAGYCTFYDGDAGNNALHYFIRPEVQCRQLREAGFGKINVYSMLTGKTITSEEEMIRSKDNWLYYECIK